MDFNRYRNKTFSTLHPLATLAALVILVLSLACAYAIEQVELRVDAQASRSSAEKRVSNVAALLSSAMNVRLNLTSSLSAFVITRKKFSATQFDSFASMLKKDLKGVMSLQLAPNSIVTYITDLKQNKQAIGHDLLADSNRRVIALKSIREHSYIISGPVKLIQGGRAIVARRPIYFHPPKSTREQFWGFATVLIDIDLLLEDTMVTSLLEDFNVAIRGKNGLGAAGDVFYGEQSVFNTATALASINLPNASWQIAVTPKPNSRANGFIHSFWYWVIVSIFSALASLITYSIVDRPRQLKHKVAQATAALRNEINNRKEAEKKVRHMALHDPLTGLPNRRLFDELGKKTLAIAKRESTSLAILFIDIDGFKNVNDCHGHYFGDTLLQMIAKRLLAQVRDPDIVARFGGDEFVILLTNNCDLEGANKVSEKIIQAISVPFEHAGIVAKVGVSIGISLYPEHGPTMEHLVQESDSAMYHAKNNGKNCYKSARNSHREVPAI